MMRVYVKKCLLILLSFLIPTTTLVAAVPAWTIVPAESSLTFTAIQNNAPVTGQFKHFSGEIVADPEQLNASYIKIIVDTGSVSDPYNQLSDTLKSPDWFNVKAFPQAVFTSKSFSKIKDKTYQAQGTLTIRNKTLPITLSFTLEDYSPSKARVKGSAVLKRTAFDVGQGEWADTKTIKDDVHIDFTVTAVKK